MRKFVCDTADAVTVETGGAVRGLLAHAGDLEADAVMVVVVESFRSLASRGPCILE